MRLGFILLAGGAAAYLFRDSIFPKEAPPHIEVKKAISSGVGGTGLGSNGEVMLPYNEFVNIERLKDWIADNPGEDAMPGVAFDGNLLSLSRDRLPGKETTGDWWNKYKFKRIPARTGDTVELPNDQYENILIFMDWHNILTAMGTQTAKPDELNDELTKETMSYLSDLNGDWWNNYVFINADGFSFNRVISQYIPEGIIGWL